RLGVVQQNGDIIWGDYLLLLYARDALGRVKNAPIIFDVKCSQALPDGIEKAGGVPVMWKTGHSLIEEKMHELHAPLAGEMSGHMYFDEGWYGFDDALYGAARLLKIVADSGTSVHQLLADVTRFVSTPEIRVDCPDDRKFGIVSDAVRYFSARSRTSCHQDNRRVSLGWIRTAARPRAVGEPTSRSLPLSSAAAPHRRARHRNRTSPRRSTCGPTSRLRGGRAARASSLR